MPKRYRATVAPYLWALASTAAVAVLIHDARVGDGPGGFLFWNLYIVPSVALAYI